MKTNDPLDDFIRSRRDEFDDKDVPGDSWKNISDSLQWTRKVSWWNNVVIWRAAAVLFMAASIYLALPSNKPSDETAENGKATLNEFSDVETFYTGEISRKVALIEELSQEGNEDDLTQDFMQLEAMYSVLKEELKNHPSKKVKDALVLNLLVRINLLNQQLQKLEDSDKPEKEARTI
jgi:hypothetical protein